MTISLSILIIARDAEHELPALFVALTPLDAMLGDAVEYVLLIDDRTVDATETIAQTSKARVYRGRFEGFGAFKEMGRRLCQGRWILNLDADERPGFAVLSALSEVVRCDARTAYTLDIRTLLAGKPTRRGPFAAERRIRLFPRAWGHWDSLDRVHETLKLSVPVQHLPGIVEHCSFMHAHDCFQRHTRYGAIAAQVRQGKPSRLKGLLRGGWRTLRCLVVHGGVASGPAGLILACCQGWGVWLKWTLGAGGSVCRSELDKLGVEAINNVEYVPVQIVVI